MSIPDELGQEVQDRATSERRGMSNMVALLLELGLNANGSAGVHAMLPDGPRRPPALGAKAFRGPDPKGGK